MGSAVAAAASAAEAVPFRVADVRIGTPVKLKLPDGAAATVLVREARETRDAVREAVRAVRVEAEVNGERVTLGSGTYHLPVEAGGVQVDCPFTRHYMTNAHQNSWALAGDVRLRLWPGRSPWLRPGAFLYPARQRWFPTDTQMSNEPSYVNGEERFDARKIYYHSGLDIGGAEGLVEVVAATDGTLVQVGTSLLKGHEQSPARPRSDVLYVVDARGWYYRYSHLHSFAAGLELGQRVRQGQKLGLLGKEGASGGWSHLHFEIKSRQPSGEWGTEDGYAFLWEAYQREQRPDLIAVARPHHVAVVGENVRLDGSRSWSRTKIARYEWSGAGAGAVAERSYPKPGTYSEILKVTDAAGRAAYDFATVQVLDAKAPGRLPPTIHAACYPNMGVRAGQAVTFKVRTYRSTEGEEVWDFGDGSAAVKVKSDGCVKPLAKDGYAITGHSYSKPGSYIARVERRTSSGNAVAHLWLEVGK